MGSISREIILERDWMKKSKVRITYKINNLETNPIPGWMREVEEVCQEQKREKLSESRGEYDHAIEFT